MIFLVQPITSTEVMGCFLYPTTSCYNILMKQRYIIANWKMKITSQKEAKKVFSGAKAVASKVHGVQTIVCVPNLYIDTLSKLAKGHRCVLGAQDLYWEESGAFTGEISASMLADYGVKYSIVGHSERREMGETSEQVSKKIHVCMKHHITPILCVGEQKRDRKGQYLRDLEKQLLDSLKGVPKVALGGVMIAYEPVWALSSTVARRDAKPQDSREMVLFLKKVLADAYGQRFSELPIFLYGGSVNKDNAEAFLKDGGVLGLLVGSASTNIDEFTAILKIQ